MRSCLTMMSHGGDFFVGLFLLQEGIFARKGVSLEYRSFGNGFSVEIIDIFFIGVWGNHYNYPSSHQWTNMAPHSKGKLISRYPRLPAGAMLVGGRVCLLATNVREQTSLPYEQPTINTCYWFERVFPCLLRETEELGGLRMSSP